MVNVRHVSTAGMLALLAGVAGAQVAAGTVLGFDGQPVRGAVVRAGQKPDEHACREVLTDERGGFEFACDEPLRWLRVQLEGVVVDVPLVRGSVQAARVSFATAAHFTLSGTLRTPDGAPAVGIDVLGRDQQGGGLLSLVTDAAGRFELRCGQPVGELVFDPMGWRHTLDGPFDRDREFVVELRENKRAFFLLRGRVLSDSAPAEDELVRGIGSGGRVVTTRTRGDGGYQLWANFPIARLEVPLALSIRRDGPFAESATAVDLDSRIHGCVLVVGRFVAADGTPLPDATIYALAEDGEVTRRDLSVGRTGADGWFQLRLPRGTPFLRFFDQENRGRTRVAFDGSVLKVRAERE